MRWTIAGANGLLQVRCAVLNGEDISNFRRWYPLGRKIMPYALVDCKACDRGPYRDPRSRSATSVLCATTRGMTKVFGARHNRPSSMALSRTPTSAMCLALLMSAPPTLHGTDFAHTWPEKAIDRGPLDLRLLRSFPEYRTPTRHMPVYFRCDGTPLSPSAGAQEELHRQ